VKNNLFNKTPMKKIKSYRCVICGNVISTCELYNTLDGRKTCANCYKIIWKIPSTLISFRPTGVESIRFTKIFGTEEGKALPYPIKSEHWVPVEKSKGYTDWVLENGFRKIAEGWSTDHPDSTTQRKVVFAEFIVKLHEREIIPPVPIYVIFGLTSNIYSTSTAVFAATKDIPGLEEWLESVDEPAYEMDDQLC
jgi:hypothetical protein